MCRFRGDFRKAFGNHLSKIQTISSVFLSLLTLAAPAFNHNICFLSRGVSRPSLFSPTFLLDFVLLLRLKFQARLNGSET